MERAQYRMTILLLLFIIINVYYIRLSSVRVEIRPIVPTPKSFIRLDGSIASCCYIFLDILPGTDSQG